WLNVAAFRSRSSTTGPMARVGGISSAIRTTRKVAAYGCVTERTQLLGEAHVPAPFEHSPATQATGGTLPARSASSETRKRKGTAGVIAESFGIVPTE